MQNYFCNLFKTYFQKSSIMLELHLKSEVNSVANQIIFIVQLYKSA